MAERDYIGGALNTVLHWESDGTMIAEGRQDCTLILEQNARKRNERFDSYSPEGTVREEAVIPLVMMQQWQQECGAPLYSDEHMAYVDKKLREPEFAYFTVAPKVRDAQVIILGAR